MKKLSQFIAEKLEKGNFGLDVWLSNGEQIRNRKENTYDNFRDAVDDGKAFVEEDDAYYEVINLDTNKREWYGGNEEYKK